jgi:oligopeptide transport system substrate-binding protein
MMTTITRSLRSAGAIALAAATVLAAPSMSHADAAAETKVLQLPMRTDGPKSLDPAEGSTQYDNIAVSQMFETLLTFSYADPNKLEPLLLEAMPTTADSGLTWDFTLRADAMFHDNACFPGGKGRAIRSDDVFYSLKRLADKRNQLKNWWLIEGAVKGFDEYKDAQNKSLDEGKPFDYDSPVDGFVKIDDRSFKIVLNKPVYRFLYILAQFQTSIVPREAVEKYGKDFSFNPVGTGPFMLDAWQPKQSLTLNRNPAYRQVLYPAREAWSREDRRRRMDRAAGQPIPFVDRMEFTMYVQDQPMWLQFQAGNLGYIEVPNEYFEEAFDKRTKELKPELAAKGVNWHKDVLLDFIFSGFNMQDEVLGGLTPQARSLRQAISLAMDLNEINEAFYQGICSVYDGPIPVGLDGHPEGGKAPVSYRGPNLDLAKKKLEAAGWPGGKNATGEQLDVQAPDRADRREVRARTRRLLDADREREQQEGADVRLRLGFGLSRRREQPRAVLRPQRVARQQPLQLQESRVRRAVRADSRHAAVAGAHEDLRADARHAAGGRAVHGLARAYALLLAGTVARQLPPNGAHVELAEIP